MCFQTAHSMPKLIWLNGGQKEKKSRGQPVKPRLFDLDKQLMNYDYLSVVRSDL